MTPMNRSGGIRQAGSPSWASAVRGPAPDASPTGGAGHRFVVLDGLRCVAALIVVVFHAVTALELTVVPRGYLAVDFFFLLSGFVIGFAYERRLRGGHYRAAFMVRRIIRVYPLCFVSAALGYLLNADPAPGLKDLVLGSLLIPQFSGWLFPVNIPLWSLFNEMVVSALYGGAGFVLKLRWLIVAFVGSALVNLAYASTTGALDAGSFTEGWVLGPMRALQSFSLGLILFRLHDPQARLPSGALLPCAALLLGFTLVPVGSGSGIWDWAMVTLGMPLILICGAAIEVSGWLRRVLLWGGDISYPIYIVHYPLLVLLGPAVRHPSRGLTILMIGVVVFASSAAAILLDRLYDRPVRRFLTRRILRLS